MVIFLLVWLPGCLRALPDDLDGDGVVAPLDCNDLNASAYPGALDLPDALLEDENCDGMDGDSAISIHLSAEHGDDESVSGGAMTPVRTLKRALALAVEQNSPAVLVDEGRYLLTLQGRLAGEPDPMKETVSWPARVTQRMPNGIGVHGGYHYDPEEGVWSRGSLNRDLPQFHGGALALEYRNLDLPTVLEAVEIHAAGGDAGGSSIGILASNTGEHLVLSHVLLQAGAGGAGPNGATGADQPGEAAGGAPGANWDNQNGIGGAGGGNTTCSGTHGGGGGAGWAANQCPDDSTWGAGCGGGTGAGSSPGAGGAAGDPTVDPYWGGDGAPGGNGASGTSTASGEPYGTMEEQSWMWVSTGTLPGTPGQDASGGGGGGGGARRGIGNSGTAAGGGGGGGAGGCGGGAGGGAIGGGGSFALVVSGGDVVLNNSTLVASDGGAGGAGGVGGRGGPGGPGGTGGVGNSNGHGGTGGSGGAGGCGGNSGGAAGGPSLAILRLPPSEGIAVTESQVSNASSSILEAGQGGAGGAGVGPATAGDPAEPCNDATEPGPDGMAAPMGCFTRMEGDDTGNTTWWELVACDEGQ